MDTLRGWGWVVIILLTKLSPGPHKNLLGMGTVHSSFLVQLVFSPFLPPFLPLPYFPHLSLSEVLIHYCVLFIFVPLTPSTVHGTSWTLNKYLLNTCVSDCSGRNWLLAGEKSAQRLASSSWGSARLECGDSQVPECKAAARGEGPGFAIWFPGLGPRVAINCLCDLSYIIFWNLGILIFER